MPECRVSQASAFLRLVNCVIPASAFRHQGQSGTASPALPSYAWNTLGLATYCDFRIIEQECFVTLPLCTAMLLKIYNLAFICFNLKNKRTVFDTCGYRFRFFSVRFKLKLMYK